MKLFFLSLLCSTFFIGCTASYDTLEMDNLKQPASQDINSADKNGLRIAATKLSGKKNEQYLGMDLASKGYTSILLNAENTADSPFKITNQNIAIVTEKGDKLNPVPISEVIENVKFSHSRAIPFWIIIIPGVFIAPGIHESVSISNELLEIDYDKKHFKGVLLGPQEQNRGFVFIKNNSDSLSHLLLNVQQQGKTDKEMTQNFTMRVKISKE
ncbi:hypothetical protein [Candidatus Uabimicrobium sp. HlEnr_7]|uniref:hypothetical protein n=1 Tax=Candidatus Uabimicrobium helgolandensis TaxID=3095367 RepID=UPI003558F735